MSEETGQAQEVSEAQKADQTILDAFSAPEGSDLAPSEEAVKDAVQKQSSAAGGQSGSGSGDGTEADKGKGGGQSSSEPKPDGQQPSYASQLREQASKKYGLEFEGDEVTPEQVFEAIEKKALGSLHPEALRMNQALANGGTIEQYFESKTTPSRLLALPNAELVKEMLTREYGKSDDNPHGLSPEDIESTVKAFENNGNLAIEASKFRRAIGEAVKKQEEEAAAFAAQSKGPDLSDPAQLKKLHEEVAASASALFEKDNSFYGLNVGKADAKEKLTERAKQLFTPNDKGVVPYHTMVQDPVRVAMIVDMVENGALSAAIHSGKEKVKSVYLDMLGQTPPSASDQPSGGGQTLSDEQAVEHFSQGIPMTTET